MNTKRKIMFAGALALTLASTAFAGERHGRDAGAAAAVPTSVVLVRVQKVMGLDATNREQVLYQNERGALVPLNNLAQIGPYLDAAKQGVADGAYHDLKVELANDLYVYNHRSEPIRTQFNAKGDPTVLGMLGTVLVANGQVQPLALAMNTGRTAAQDPYATSDEKNDWRYGERKRRHHDDDDEDDDD